MRAVHPVVVINFQVKVRLAPSLLTICSLPLGRMPQLQFQLYPQTIQPVALACVDSCTQITKISVHMQRSRCRQRCLLNLGNLLQIQPLPLPLSAIVSLGRICASGALLCNQKMANAKCGHATTTITNNHNKSLHDGGLQAPYIATSRLHRLTYPQHLT